MPGRTPQEAFRAFIEPIQESLSCLGSAKITPSAGHQLPDIDHSWTINGANGLALSGGYHFEAQMHYRIVKVEEGWKVTTLAYRYRIARAGEDMVLFHWHPAGNSNYRAPHLHLPNFGQGEDGHLPTGRMTFEDAVEWMVKASDQPARPDWEDVLAHNKANHLAHRTWDTSPDETK